MMTVSLYNCGHCKLPQLVGQRCHCRTEDDDDTQVYKRPWVGLTDEEIRDCLGPEAVRIPPGWSRLTRAIEAKLKEKNND